MMKGESQSEFARPKLGVWRTLRFAVREAWDVLGLVCAASFTLFLGAAACVFLSLTWVPAGLVAAVLLMSPLFTGTCYLAHRVYQHDEPGYFNLWEGFRRLYLRSVTVGAVQLFVFIVLIANLAFYGQRQGFGFLLASIVIWYLIAYWLVNALYHYPLLIAADQGVLKREEGGPPRVRTTFRNAFVLAMSAPGYSLAILVAVILITIPLFISAVGMALVGTALPAFIATRATRDQLIRHGLLPPDPDPDEPAVDEVWKMRG
jgi:hypothetical protein